MVQLACDQPTRPNDRSSEWGRERAGARLASSDPRHLPPAVNFSWLRADGKDTRRYRRIRGQPKSGEDG